MISHNRRQPNLQQSLIVFIAIICVATGGLYFRTWSDTNRRFDAARQLFEPSRVALEEPALTHTSGPREELESEVEGRLAGVEPRARARYVTPRTSTDGDAELLSVLPTGGRIDGDPDTGRRCQPLAVDPDGNVTYSGSPDRCPYE